MTHELQKQSPERRLNQETLSEDQEQHERLREEIDKRAAERSPENDSTGAQIEAKEYAKSIEKTNNAEIESVIETQRGPIGKREREASFSSTITEVQSQMSATDRVFSKAIHNKVVEQASEVLGSTVARPNALLSGALFAFIITLTVYLVAKNIGYPLSGFESIGSFILGWIIGVLYDFVKVMITGRR